MNITIERVEEDDSAWAVIADGDTVCHLLDTFVGWMVAFPRKRFLGQEAPFQASCAALAVKVALEACDLPEADAARLAGEWRMQNVFTRKVQVAA